MKTSTSRLFTSQSPVQYILGSAKAKNVKIRCGKCQSTKGKKHTIRYAAGYKTALTITGRSALQEQKNPLNDASIKTKRTEDRKKKDIHNIVSMQRENKK
jgi:small-conductance mechanosensitive channel